MKKKKAPLNTSLRPDAAFGDFDSFAELFQQVEQRLEYWVEGAKNEFTEKTVRRMQELDVTRTELAERLGKKQSHITKLLGGNNNFTIETMVRIAEALDCHFRCHLEPVDCDTHWVDLVRTGSEPIRNEPKEPQTEPENEDADITIAA
ncbi:MAG: helix-turn-helix domain-containing protein [Opitutales bacterium]